MEGGGTSWIGRGHVCQGSGKGQREPLGTRLVGEFAPELSACTGLPRRASEAPKSLPAGNRRRSRPLVAQEVPPGALTPHLGALPLPCRQTPPPTHVLPSPPLVTLALTYINPISHTRTNSPAQHTQAHPDKEGGPQRGLVCPWCLFASA